jgi:TRAP-type C4-dicarboxylate transport system permease small subunit
VLLTSQIIEIMAILSLLYWSAEVTWKIQQWIMPAMEISRAYVYGACPVGSFFMLVYALRNLVAEFKKKEDTTLNLDKEGVVL